MKRGYHFFCQPSFCGRVLTVLLIAPLTVMHAQGAELTLTGPLDYQVVQRTSPEEGRINIAGALSEDILSGKLYRESLEKIIRESRRELGFEAVWFVAQASYHTPTDVGSDDIRAAQASLWKDGIALEGPDSDALKGKLREHDGNGVHFSGPGLREHGASWAAKVLPWLDRQRTPAISR